MWVSFRDAAGMNDEDMRAFVWQLGKLGFVWQFITLGGLHANALATGKLGNNAHKSRAGYSYLIFSFLCSCIQEGWHVWLCQQCPTSRTCPEC